MIKILKEYNATIEIGRLLTNPIVKYIDLKITPITLYVHNTQNLIYDSYIEYVLIYEESDE